jgi:hypothetical protein
MSYYKFKDSDVLVNYIKSYPQQRFYIYDSKVYLNNKQILSGAFTGSVLCIPSGYTSLYELNVDRHSGSANLIYPFIEKGSARTSFRTTTTSEFDSDFDYGDVITGSYPLSASIQRYYYQIGQARKYVSPLQNTLNYYSNISPHYSYSSSYGDKSTQEICLLDIPSIFYGSQIKKGTVKLDFYITGTLVGRLEDNKKNGELIQTLPYGSNGSGSTAGVVLYNEGIVLLTGSWGLETGVTRNYLNDYINLVTSSWVYFGNGFDGNVKTGAGDLQAASYLFSFSGSNITPVMTMFANAPRAELNHSNNKTYITHGQYYYTTGSNFFIENSSSLVKNTNSYAYTDYSGTLEKQTFISKVGIYDENKNLIGIAKLAKPVKKTEERDLTFKLKIDL